MRTLQASTRWLQGGTKMRIGWNLLIVGTAVTVLLVSVGCARKTEGEPEGKTASISGPTDNSRADASASAGDKKASPSADPKHPQVELQTTLGKIVVELDKEGAPTTVDKFLRYVESGHYDRTIFHQIVKEYVIMGGGYTETLAEKKTEGTIRNEAALAKRTGLTNVAGTIAMVRKPDCVDSATCQFFINVVDNPNLDYKGPSAEEYGYCPFGKVISGMEVVKKIADVEVTDKAVEVAGKKEKAEFERVPKQAVVIQSARLFRR
jgi:cyclophilin family peptidyl-prolyl cis-trans isomerase